MGHWPFPGFGIVSGYKHHSEGRGWSLCHEIRQCRSRSCGFQIGGLGLRIKFLEHYEVITIIRKSWLSSINNFLSMRKIIILYYLNKFVFSFFSSFIGMHTFVLFYDNDKCKGSFTFSWLHLYFFIPTSSTSAYPLPSI